MGKCGHAGRGSGTLAQRETEVRESCPEPGAAADRGENMGFWER